MFKNLSRDLFGNDGIYKAAIVSVIAMLILFAFGVPTIVFTIMSTYLIVYVVMVLSYLVISQGVRKGMIVANADIQEAQLIASLIAQQQEDTAETEDSTVEEDTDELAAMKEALNK